MRILHTADRHAGRTLRGRSRADEHRAILAEIVGVATDEQVDLVVLAGDVFDSASPSPESENLVCGTLLSITATGAETVIVAGNHDSPHRLNAIRPLLQLIRVHTAAFPASRDAGGVIDIRTRREHARVAALPSLSQRDRGAGHPLSSTLGVHRPSCGSQGSQQAVRTFGLPTRRSCDRGLREQRRSPRARYARRSCGAVQSVHLMRRSMPSRA